MLNSKLKRSMAWIMTAAVVMTAVPVSAADFSSEADIEVSAETAEVGEESTVFTNTGEDNSNSVDISINDENDADFEEVITEDNTEDSDDAKSTFSDGKEATVQNTDAEEFTDNGNMTVEELAETFAAGDTNVEDDAPWSSVDSLPAGTYENVTANLYVPGAQNKILGDISIIDGNSVAIKSWEKAVLGNVREFESNSNDIFDIIMRELENDK